MPDESTQRASVRASDADREAAVRQLEQALGEGRITVGEFQQRAGAAAAAVTTAELGPLLADLPAAQPPPADIVGRHAPPSVFNVLGDLRFRGGGGELPRRAGTVLGNIRIDLRELRTDADVVELDLWTVLGDIDVILPEGVDGVLDGWAVLGDRKIELAPVPRVSGTPRVVVRAHAVLGNLRLRSLAPGEPLSRWHRWGRREI
jgi:hypothetical protein